MKPYKIAALGNDKLAIEDLGHNRMVWIVDIDAQQAKSFVPRGIGPDELLDLSTMSYANGILTVAGLNDSKIIDYSVDPDSISICQIAKTTLPYHSPLRSLRLNDSIVFSLSPAFTGDRYYFYNRKDSTYSATTDFPLDKEKIGANPDNAFFQAEIAVSENGSLVVVANRDWDILEFYDVDADKWKIIYGPEVNNAEIKKIENGMVSFFRQTPKYYSWETVAVGKEKVYVGYNGSCLREKGDEDTGVAEILTFDYSGNPDKIYRFDIPVISFAIDEQAKRIYAIHNIPDPTLVYYNL
ncbi:MAG: TolB-like 6-bladed beta-propeller domain-containing protein [Clostridium sp.]|nr:TolB-like 6-bladed beta-propeller domain-containing protein [Clostridium sp.]